MCDSIITDAIQSINIVEFYTRFPLLIGILNPLRNFAEKFLILISNSTILAIFLIQIISLETQIKCTFGTEQNFRKNMRDLLRIFTNVIRDIFCFNTSS